MDKDKKIEQERYNNRASSLLSEDKTLSGLSENRVVLPVLRAPYLCYKFQIKQNKPDNTGRILEIGSGTGAFTKALLETEAQVYATDISSHSLKVIRTQFKKFNNLITKVADMEALPFGDNSFELVTSAGSLSYGDNTIVMNEIFRVLKPGGFFISVDSLNHNPVYRLNRLIHYFKGNRTLSTLQRMPTIQLIEQYKQKFGSVEVFYFGGISWLLPVLKVIFNESKIVKISDKFDKMINVKKMAFKFVMVVKKDLE